MYTNRHIDTSGLLAAILEFWLPVSFVCVSALALLKWLTAPNGGLAVGIFFLSLQEADIVLRRGKVILPRVIIRFEVVVVWPSLSTIFCQRQVNSSEYLEVELTFKFFQWLRFSTLFLVIDRSVSTRALYFFFFFFRLFSHLTSSPVRPVAKKLEDLIAHFGGAITTRK